MLAEGGRRRCRKVRTDVFVPFRGSDRDRPAAGDAEPAVAHRRPRPPRL